MRGKLVIVLAALALLASGCYWNQPGFDASGSNDNFTETVIGANNVASLHARWSSTALPNTPKFITQSSAGLIDVTDGTTLAALNPDTGATVWSRTEPSGTTVSAATGDGDDILVTTFDSSTLAANLETWDARTGATVSTTPIAPTGQALSGATGGVSGVTKSGPWVVTTWSEVAFSNIPGVLPNGDTGVQVTNLDNPALSWSFDEPSTNTAQIHDYSGAIILGNRLYLTDTTATYIATIDGEIPDQFASSLAAWNLSGCTNQCTQLFETPGGGPIGSPDGQTLYADASGGIAALDPATGAQRWAAAAIPGNSSAKVYAATDDAVVAVLTTFTSTNEVQQLAVYPATCANPCTPTWTTDIPGEFETLNSAIVANGLVYTNVDNAIPATHTLAAYPIECTNGCQPISTVPADDFVTAGPIVSNGQLLYGTECSTAACTPTSGTKVVALTP
jgi:hypothetical protein